MYTYIHLSKKSLNNCYKVHDIEFKTQNRAKIQKTHKEEKLVFERTRRKCRLLQTRIRQNNDHTRIICKIQFRSYFKDEETFTFPRLNNPNSTNSIEKQRAVEFTFSELVIPLI